MSALETVQYRHYLEKFAITARTTLRFVGDLSEEARLTFQEAKRVEHLSFVVADFLTLVCYLRANGTARGS